MAERITGPGYFKDLQQETVRLPSPDRSSLKDPFAELPKHSREFMEDPILTNPSASGAFELIRTRELALRASVLKINDCLRENSGTGFYPDEILEKCLPTNFIKRDTLTTPMYVNSGEGQGLFAFSRRYGDQAGVLVIRDSDFVSAVEKLKSESGEYISRSVATAYGDLAQFMVSESWIQLKSPDGKQGSASLRGDGSVVAVCENDDRAYIVRPLLESAAGGGVVLRFEALPAKVDVLGRHEPAK